MRHQGRDINLGKLEDYLQEQGTFLNVSTIVATVLQYKKIESVPYIPCQVYSQEQHVAEKKHSGYLTLYLT